MSSFPSGKQLQVLGAWCHGGSILHYTLPGLPSSSTALLTDEREGDGSRQRGGLGGGATGGSAGFLGRRGESWAGRAPVLGLPTEKIGEHAGNHRLLSINVSHQKMTKWCSASSLHSGHRASVATSTNWHFSVIFLLWFLNAIPSFTVSLFLFKINLTVNSVLFSLMLPLGSTEFLVESHLFDHSPLLTIIYALPWFVTHKGMIPSTRIKSW